MNGVVKNQTYYEWLATQDDKFQDFVLGKERAKLFRDGGLSPTEFSDLQLDKNFKPRTLDEIRAIEPKGFEGVFGDVLQSSKIDESAIMRTDWGDFPNALIAHTKDTITTHKYYQKAKAGDAQSAFLLVDEFLSDDFVKEMGQSIRHYKDVHIVPVHAEEQQGRNKIPMAYALALSEILGVKMDLGIVQADRAYRTSSDGVGRLLKRVNFDGDVVAGRHYVIVDDVITQGGTLADLHSFIENKGGSVILASTLNGKPNSAKLPITKATLGQFANKLAKNLNTGGRSNLVMTSQNSQNLKQDTLPNKSTGTALTASEIRSLRQDLKEAYEQGKGFFKARRLQTSHY
ncbi:phosphoribosyltransferase [Moraxella nasovis]|uniref:phosphoribosyltransferase n=1 Tax=Moraxella nasovis TaxID=2904121 RepID=UPI001F60DB21|nr:phosphoribosyltransferase [Moraxella nasovis]UNU73275.1 phosphoribosyltransferase [Moraxella nasovis]